MSNQLEQIIRHASQALEPIPTEIAAHSPFLKGIRAVLFDIYGTLLVSGSGDIGIADPTGQGPALAGALQSVVHRFTGDANRALTEFRQVIAEHHERSRASGVPFPEVDIIEVWQETTERLQKRGELAQRVAAEDLRRLAVEFEVRVNPVWPMPQLVACLSKLRGQGLVMGIISNAQFFTPLLFPALVDKSLDQLGFDAKLRYYSFEHRSAKPGQQLYQRAVHDLATRNIEPFEVLYVGNDMRNDIGPAAKVGFRTALFAGDQRSLRMRTEDADSQARPKPDAILTHLNQILPMIRSEGMA